MKLGYYETCNSQYHRGHRQPTVQVKVDGTSTVRQVKEQLLDYPAYEHLEYAVFTTGGYYAAYKKAVEEYFSVIPPGAMDQTWDSTLEVPEDEDEDDEWGCYSYFVLVEIDQHLVEKIRNNPGKCPYCGSDELVTKTVGGKVSISARCNSCQSSWVENYTLEGVTFGEKL